MDMIVWGTIGLVEGWLASSIFEQKHRHFVFDVLLGVIGALTGGYFFYQFTEPRLFGVQLYSLTTALISGILFLTAAILVHTAKDPKKFLEHK